MKMNEIKVIERLGNLLNVKVMVTWELVSKASGWMIQSDWIGWLRAHSPSGKCLGWLISVF